MATGGLRWITGTAQPLAEALERARLRQQRRQDREVGKPSTGTSRRAKRGPGPRRSDRQRRGGRRDRLGRRGSSDAPSVLLCDLFGEFVRNQGKVWLCGACTKPRGIVESDLIEGAKIVTAANVVEYLASGAATLSF